MPSIKHTLLFLFIFAVSFHTYSQVERAPIYPGCDENDLDNLDFCFDYSVRNFIYEHFNIPNTVTKTNYNGEVKVYFVVDKNGQFEVLYVNTMYKELEAEAKRVFANLPQVKPATFNGRAIENQYIIPIKIPLTKPTQEITNTDTSEKGLDVTTVVKNTSKNLFPEFESELNIPFTHRSYDNLIYHLQKGQNTHSAFKPYIYNEVKPYVDLKAQRETILKDKTSWGGRKLWNEHFVLVNGKNFWFTVNPMLDLQLGKDNSDVDYTYNNTRAVQIQGALGKKFSFQTSLYESQGRFADYFNQYARSMRTNDGNTYVVPGRGKAKVFKDDGFDYPVAEAYISYTPNNFFNFQFGNGKNFIGDGYRSLLLSDGAPPSTFFKISTKFWKIKYTNLWMWTDDVRPSSGGDNGRNLRKYVAIHHLSWNATERLNIGLFESVTTNNINGDGFDIAFFNPIIFYRSVEFGLGSESGNAQIGLNLKYKFSDNFYAYNQLLIDEMTVGEVFSGDGYWGNKFGLQFGAKYFDAFKVKNLMLQGEFNWVRPYTYSHQYVDLNNGHYNQSLSHQWGGNFWETIAIARYNKNRWFGSAKFVIGKKGFDFNNSNISYGGDIYKSYDDRVSDYNNEVGQGNTSNIFIADLQGGYVVNPVHNFQLFAGFTYRDFDPVQAINSAPNSTTWFTVGLRSEVFNWYFDF